MPTATSAHARTATTTSRRNHEDVPDSGTRVCRAPRTGCQPVEPAAVSLTLDLARRHLEEGELTVAGRLPWSSNATFLVLVALPEEPLSGAAEELPPLAAPGETSATAAPGGSWPSVAAPGEPMLAVYKPQQGERPLWDFAGGSLCRREAAAFAVSEALGWRLVPPTVLRPGPYGVGMVQAFIQHDPETHYLRLVDPDPFTMQRLVAFDVVINNADRKSGHVLLAADGALWAIDHGVSFHVEPKLRTVVWEWAGEAIPGDMRRDLLRLARELDDGESPTVQDLAPLLSPEEVAATAQRARGLARSGHFPVADPERRSYPWPPI